MGPGGSALSSLPSSVRDAARPAPDAPRAPPAAPPAARWLPRTVRTGLWAPGDASPPAPDDPRGPPSAPLAARWLSGAVQGKDPGVTGAASLSPPLPSNLAPPELAPELGVICWVRGEPGGRPHFLGVYFFFGPLVVHLHVVRLFQPSHNHHVPAPGGPSRRRSSPGAVSLHHRLGGPRGGLAHDGGRTFLARAGPDARRFRCRAGHQRGPAPRMPGDGPPGLPGVPGGLPPPPLKGSTMRRGWRCRRRLQPVRSVRIPRGRRGTAAGPPCPPQWRQSRHRQWCRRLQAAASVAQRRPSAAAPPR